MNYTVKPIYGTDPFSGMPTDTVIAWVVMDFQQEIVARCKKAHNAELICRLLNWYT